MLDFTLPANNGTQFALNACHKPLVIFFYPKDNTPGCTLENQDFAKLSPQFATLGYELVGISRDTINSHCRFAEKFQLPFMLLADTEEVVCNLFNVIKDKKMYGKPVRGIERSTFILDINKEIIKEWRKVTVDNHAQEVLDWIRQNG
jgi:thioredoxin-dependent peroxiredoxin